MPISTFSSLFLFNCVHSCTISYCDVCWRILHLTVTEALWFDIDWGEQRAYLTVNSRYPSEVMESFQWDSSAHPWRARAERIHRAGLAGRERLYHKAATSAHPHWIRFCLMQASRKPDPLDQMMCLIKGHINSSLSKKRVKNRSQDSATQQTAAVNVDSRRPALANTTGKCQARAASTMAGYVWHTGYPVWAEVVQGEHHASPRW